MCYVKNAAVITYHRHDNYGALLQCYALQEALKKLKVDGYVIDYVCKADENPLSFDALHSRGIKACILSFAGMLTRLPRHRRFEEFRKQLPLTQRVDKTNIELLGDCYDCYLAGSDNIWNGEITGWDANYFLEFVKDKNKRKSYAASFGGGSIPEGKEKKCAEYVKGISELLIREEAGAALIEKLTGRKAQVVVDPTLLLPSSHWQKIMAKRQINEKYVLAYQLVPSADFVHKAEQMVEKMGCRLVFIPFPFGKWAKAQWRLRDGPREWLSLIFHSEYVLTDSFHGTVFSILFHKQFAVLVSQLGARIENLLQTVGLLDRIIQPDQDVPVNKIDYAHVDEKIEKARLESLDKLKKVLECKEVK